MRADVLRVQHPDDELDRALLLHGKQAARQHRARGGIVGAVEPELAPPAMLPRRTPGEALEAGRPAHRAQAQHHLGLAQRRLGQAPGRHDGKAAILDLMHTGQGRTRQLDPAVARLDHDPASGLVRIPVAPVDESGAPISAARRSITARAAGSWRPITAGTPALRMPAFSAAIAGSVSPR